jgi:uncharacterized repeat protein (TIGR01451 family)
VDANLSVSPPVGGAGGGGGGTPGITLAVNPPDQTIRSGGTATFTVTVTNGGTLAIQNVQVSDAAAPGCSQTPVGNSALGAIAAGASVSYSCTLANLSGSVTNNASVTALAANSATVTANASASVTVVAPLIPPQTSPPPRTAASSGLAYATVRIRRPKAVRLKAKHPSIALTVTVSTATLLHLTLTTPKGARLAGWVRREQAGTHTITLHLPAKALRRGHDELRITEAGNPTAKTIGVTIAA